MAQITLHRPARSFPEVVSPEEVQIVTPPTLPPPQGLLATLAQNVLMPLGGMAGMLYVFIFPTPLVVKIALGAASSVGMLAPLLTRFATGRTARKRKAVERVKYLAYLGEREEELRRCAEMQHSALLRVHPDPDMLWHAVTQRQTVWERRPSHDDFLALRAGLGNVRLWRPAHLDLGNNPLTEYEPALRDAATELSERYQTLAEAPVVVSLRDHPSVAITGPRRRARGVVRAMLCELAAFHAAEDVQVLLYAPAEADAEWSWVKWLPHLRDTAAHADGSAPPTLRAHDIAGIAELLHGALRERSEELRRSTGHDAPPWGLPHLVLVIDGYGPDEAVSRLASLNEFLGSAAALHVSVISLVESRVSEPPIVDVRLEVTDSGELTLEQASAAGLRIRDARADNADLVTCEGISRALAPLRVTSRKAKQEFADDIRLLDLLKLPTAASVDPVQTWKPRSPEDVMRVPIGVSSEGDPLLLDLKEAAVGGMGPHGMVIGATGSGKSELLRTLVTGLAVEHPPDILNFVFVDFKGGAAFADLATLPHVAGMITNLQGDLSRVDRMHAALVGEQERRQRLLREAGNLDGIKEYQAARAAHPEMTPMPYLMIVVDEFGELLTARPDFLDLFMAIGRVGRSLGMHLLLATQRLEEGKIRGLEGHLRYRICLRTFSAQESQTVIGTADAYHLPSNPGAGYFKVDTSIYRRFKCALISGPVGAAGSVRRASGLAVFDGLHHSTAGRSSAASNVNAGGPTEMEVAIARLCERGGSGVAVHQVWLPPLQPAVTLDEVLQRSHAATRTSATSPHPFGALRVPLGLLDRPQQQSIDPLLLDFAGGAGHLAIVGAPQTGKSTFVRTLISSFALTHSPEEVHFYCLDLGGGSLYPLESLPHVGSVCGKQERDRMRRTIRQMSSLMEERELLFRKEGIDSIATFRRRRQAGELSAGTLGDVFLVIDNWAQLRQEIEEIDAEIAPLLASGLGFGIHVIITSGRWNDMRPAVRDAIATRFEFRLNDPLESELPRGANASLPLGVPGRAVNGQTQQFQIALPRIDGSTEPVTAQDAQEQLVRTAVQRWTEAQSAPSVRLLPALVRIEELPDPATVRSGVPIGLEEFRLEPVCLDLLGAEPHFLILGDSESGKTTMIRAWMHQLRRRHTPQQLQFVLVDYRRTLLDAAGGDHISRYAATAAITKDAVEELRRTLTERLPGADVTREELLSRSWWKGPEYVVFVDDYDLVVSPTGNPLAPLIELLPQGRDVGVHLVLARRVGGIARSAFEPVFQRIKELGTPGIIMSGDPQEGIVLGTQKAAQQPPGRGFLVRRGQRTALVQVARADAAD